MGEMKEEDKSREKMSPPTHGKKQSMIKRWRQPYILSIICLIPYVTATSLNFPSFYINCFVSSMTEQFRNMRKMDKNFNMEKSREKGKNF